MNFLVDAGVSIEEWRGGESFKYCLSDVKCDKNGFASLLTFEEILKNQNIRYLQQRLYDCSRQLFKYVSKL